MISATEHFKEHKESRVGEDLSREAERGRDEGTRNEKVKLAVFLVAASSDHPCIPPFTRLFDPNTTEEKERECP